MNPAPNDKPPETPPASPEIPPAPPSAVPSAAAEPIPKAAGPRLFLDVTAVALVGWLAWLSAAALNKSREPVVSRAQAAMAPIPVRAAVKAKDGKPDPTVTVIEPLKGDKPTKGATLLVTNLPVARGFEGEGEYLLLLAPDMAEDGLAFQLVSLRTSSADTDPPPVYRWGTDVAKQVERLYRDR